jgi:hypothetical protein
LRRSNRRTAGGNRQRSRNLALIGSGLMDNSLLAEISMNNPFDTWSFVVRVRSIGLDVEFELENAALVRHQSLRIEGDVQNGQDLIIGTTVYATIWARDDPRAQEAHEAGRLGSVSVSKDVATVRTISSEDPFQIAGIDIHIALLQSEFRELLDSLALADAAKMTLSFNCVGPSLRQPGPFAGLELVLEGENAKLSVVGFRLARSVV